ncbi:hypothetical protein LJC36_01755 [Desulfovibrio sp. OttesenSCG-928-C14]|nr:hypothetical protein [Desulfovibrio sp. OttesenSCG-928-C14]
MDDSDLVHFQRKGFPGKKPDFSAHFVLLPVFAGLAPWLFWLYCYDFGDKKRGSSPHGEEPLKSPVIVQAIKQLQDRLLQGFRSIIIRNVVADEQVHDYLLFKAYGKAPGKSSGFIRPALEKTKIPATV